MSLVEEWVADASMVDLQMVVTVLLTFLPLPFFFVEFRSFCGSRLWDELQLSLGLWC